MNRPTQISRRAFLMVAGLGGVGGALWLLKSQLPPRFNPILALTAEHPAIIAREDWGALPPDHDAPNEHGFYSLDNPEGYRVYQGNWRDRYNTVVIHHAATFGRDDRHTLHYIMDTHRNVRGWADIAYHYFIGRTGLIYQGRPLNVRGVHVAGYNTGSVGVCLLGNLERTQPTAEQLVASQMLVNWLAQTLALTHLAGHTEFNPESVCPGAHMMPYLDDLAAGANLQRGTSGYIPSEEQIIATATAAATLSR